MNRDQVATEDRTLSFDEILVENSDRLLALVDLHGRILRANARFSAFVENTEAELLGTPFWDAMAGNLSGLRQHELIASFESAKAGVEARSVNEQYGSDGGANCVILDLRPIRSMCGDIAHIEIAGRILENCRKEQCRQLNELSAVLLDREGELNKARQLAQLGHWHLTISSGIVRWSDEIRTLLGYSEDAPPPRFEDHAVFFSPASWAEITSALDKTIQTGAPFSLDVEVTRPDERRCWLTVSGHAECNHNGQIESVRGIAQDITARKHAELALRESEKRCQQLFLNAPSGIEMIDLEGRITLANPALCKLLGCELSELIGKSLSAVTHPDDVETDEHLFRQLVTCQISTYEVEKRKYRNDGQELWVLIIRTLVKTEDGAPCYVISQLVDITERKQATTRVTRLSSLYAALSDSNVAILKSKSPAEVYRAVCQACVKHAGFRLAWIGTPDPLLQQLLPIEAAGPELAFLKKLRVSIAEGDSASRGPSGRAFIEQQACSCPRINDDPDLHPWHDAARAHGLTCAVSLPLQRGGAPFGVLTVYGKEESYCDAEAIQLLREMANNISFALDHFDSEAARELASQALLASEARLNEAQAVSRMGDWQLDRVTGLVTWSPQLFKLLERPIELGPPDLNESLQYYEAETLEATRQTFWHAIDTGERCVIEQDLVLHSGKKRHFITTIVPFKDPDGRVIKLYGTVQDITERKQLEHDLAENLARLSELSAHMIEVQEQERRKLAAELHDQASPNLAALQLTLANLVSALPESALPTIEPLLEDAQALLADTSAGIRDICTNLRPATLDYAGLVPALQDYTRQFSKRSGARAQFKHTGFDATLPKNIESLLFRIAQEALANSTKHALASNILIELSNVGHRLVMRIADDGIGFDPATLGVEGHPPGLGLITMRERAEFAGGVFNVVSEKGRGTEINVTFDDVTMTGYSTSHPQRRASDFGGAA